MPGARRVSMKWPVWLGPGGGGLDSVANREAIVR